MTSGLIESIGLTIYKFPREKISEEVKMWVSMHYCELPSKEDTHILHNHVDTHLVFLLAVSTAPPPFLKHKYCGLASEFYPGLRRRTKVLTYKEKSESRFLGRKEQWT